MRPLAFALLIALTPAAMPAFAQQDTAPAKHVGVDDQAIMTSQGFLSAHPDLGNRLQGLDSLEDGNFKRALQDFRRASRYGDKPSQGVIAEMYWNGQGVEVDRATAYAGAQTPTSPPVGAVVQRFGDPEVDNHSLSFNGELDAADYLTFYSYGLYTKRETLSNGFFRPAGDSRNIPSIYPDGFLPQIFNTGTDYGLVLGMKSSIGSTNFDNRSFALNEELNLTVYNRALAQRLEAIFREDLKHSKKITYEEWQSRSVFERLWELFAFPVKEQL